MKQVSRGSGEGKGELSRPARRGAVKRLSPLLLLRKVAPLVKLPLGGLWSIANRDEVTIQARDNKDAV